jgi:hypothetical protein
MEIERSMMLPMLKLEALLLAGEDIVESEVEEWRMFLLCLLGGKPTARVLSSPLSRRPKIAPDNELLSL